MKKILSLILCSIFVFSTCACNKLNDFKKNRSEIIAKWLQDNYEFEDIYDLAEHNDSIDIDTLVEDNREPTLNNLMMIATRCPNTSFTAVLTDNRLLSDQSSIICDVELPLNQVQSTMFAYSTTGESSNNRSQFIFHEYYFDTDEAAQKYFNKCNNMIEALDDTTTIKKHAVDLQTDLTVKMSSSLNVKNAPDNIKWSALKDSGDYSYFVVIKDLKSVTIIDVINREESKKNNYIDILKDYLIYCGYDYDDIFKDSFKDFTANYVESYE